MDNLFQTSRSLDIGLILANQSMTDLNETDRGLASAVESNCHFRQWFSVKNASEIESLSHQFGKREVIRSSYTENDNGTSRTWRVEEVLRASNIHRINVLKREERQQVMLFLGFDSDRISTLLKRCERLLLLERSIQNSVSYGLEKFITTAGTNEHTAEHKLAKRFFLYGSSEESVGKNG